MSYNVLNSMWLNGKFMVLDFESHSNILVGASMIKVHERLNKMEKKLLWYYWPLVAAALKIGRRRGGERLYFCSLCKPKLLFQFHRPLGSMPKSFIGWIWLVILKNHKSYFKIILTNSQNFRLNTQLKSKTLDQLNIAIMVRTMYYVFWSDMNPTFMWDMLIKSNLWLRGPLCIQFFEILCYVLRFTSENMVLPIMVAIVT